MSTVHVAADTVPCAGATNGNKVDEVLVPAHSGLTPISEGVTHEINRVI